MEDRRGPALVAPPQPRSPRRGTRQARLRPDPPPRPLVQGRARGRQGNGRRRHPRHPPVRTLVARSRMRAWRFRHPPRRRRPPRTLRHPLGRRNAFQDLRPLLPRARNPLASASAAARAQAHQARQAAPRATSSPTSISCRPSPTGPAASPTGSPEPMAPPSSLRHFVDHASDYAAHRDLPAEDATSRLSPHLHHGETQPPPGLARRSAARAARNSTASSPGAISAARSRSPIPMSAKNRSARSACAPATAKPPTPTSPPGPAAAPAIPLVDAGMRQLWQIGLDAQPRPARHRQLPVQASADRLVARRRLVLGLPGRRRLCEQQPELAMGRRHRLRQPALLPDHGPARPKREIRRRRLHPRVGARTRQAVRCRHPRPVGQGRRARRLSRAADRPQGRPRTRAGGLSQTRTS